VLLDDDGVLLDLPAAVPCAACPALLARAPLLWPLLP